MVTTGRTSLLFKGETAASGDIVNVQLAGDRPGTVQCDFDEYATKGFKMEIQGRINSGMNWTILLVIDETDIDENGSMAASVRLMPQMRAEVVSVTNSPSTDGIEAWLVE